MSKNPRNDRYPAEFSSRQRRLRSGSKLPSAINLPPSSGRARVCPKNKFASSDDNTAFAAARDGDPEYLFFLHHLRLEGSGYVFEMPAAGGLANPMRWKYEEDEVTRHRTRPQPHPQPQKQRKRASETNVERDREPEKRQRTISASAKTGFTSTSPSSGEVRLMYDEDYHMFLDRVTMRDDGSMVVQWDNNVTIVYEEESVDDDNEVVVIEDEKSAKVNNVDIILIDTDSCYGSPPLPPPKHNDIKSLLQILRGKSPSTFTNRLMSVLEKPFDKKEYDELMFLATRRKPITRLKHLREDSVPYETDLIGCSYLDRYPDLAKQIQSTEKETALFLLRGFFFWLKNIGHVGAYMPWSATSSSCMSTMFLDSKNAHNISDKFSKNEL